MTMETGIFDRLEAIIGTDVGNRGMKALIIPGDLEAAAVAWATSITKNNHQKDTPHDKNVVLILSGFPCCVSHNPPTETDGPPGALALARLAEAVGQTPVIVTDDCNGNVFRAGLSSTSKIQLETFPPDFAPEDETRFQSLLDQATCMIACERAGPAADGQCYTMRGISMNQAGLIAPLHRLVEERPKDRDVPFIAIGDGGNELGMGKAWNRIQQQAGSNKDEPPSALLKSIAPVACVVPSDHLIAASVSNWGAFALCAATAWALTNNNKEKNRGGDTAASNSKDVFVSSPLSPSRASWLSSSNQDGSCGLPTLSEETVLLKQLVAAGCRDGVSGQLEATVDGMPLETSLECLREIRAAVVAADADNIEEKEHSR